MENFEQILFQIISQAGTARSNYIQATELAQKGAYDAADRLVQEGIEAYRKAHLAHAELITKDAGGELGAVSLLLLHAEDLLMSCEVFRTIQEHVASLCQRLDALEGSRE